jgi:hypothetical protein
MDINGRIADGERWIFLSGGQGRKSTLFVATNIFSVASYKHDRIWHAGMDVCLSQIP